MLTLHGVDQKAAQNPGALRLGLSARRRLSHGQTMVEFAMVIPVLLLVMMGVMEGGRLLFTYTSVSAAGREAARYAAGIGQVSSGSALYDDCDGIRAAAKRIGFFPGITDTNITIYHDKGPDDPSPVQYCATPLHQDTASLAAGDRVVVQVDVSYSPMVPLLPIPPITLHTQNAHTVLRDAQVVATPQPTPIGGYPKCDTSPYTVTMDNPTGNKNAKSTYDINITLSTSSTAATIKNILAIWDSTSHPALTDVSSTTATLGPTTFPYNTLPINSVSPTYPTYNNGILNGDVTTTNPQKFKLTFDSQLKSNLIVQFSLVTPDGACMFGQ